jgi:tetratricopeptide (TPR) repeat protein
LRGGNSPTPFSHSSGQTYRKADRALNDKGNPDGAIASCKEAIRLDPKYVHAHHNLGHALQLKGDLAGAISSYREAIRLDPRYVHAHSNLGSALQAKGDVHGALACYKEALRIDPKHAFAHNNIASLLATGSDGVRDGRRAVEHATRACELTGWKHFATLDTLASAYAEAGEFDKAVEFQSKALSLPTFPKAKEAVGRRRLDLYSQRTPYRDPALSRREVAPPPRPAR